VRLAKSRYRRHRRQEGHYLHVIDSGPSALDADGMRSYHLDTLGSTDGICLREREEPKPGPTEILVRVHAASLNRRDSFILAGTYPLPPKRGVVPLSDGAGEVVAAGDAVTRFKVGDRVTGCYFPRWRDGRMQRDIIDQLGCTLDGMLTEDALLDEQWAVKVPDHLTWEEAATLTCAGVTAWSSLVGSEPMIAGQTVLTLGTGGVSLFAIQFAKLFGCRVISLTSSEAKFDKLRALGADHVLNYATTPEWGQAVRDLTDGEGVDRVVETFGPETIEQSMRASALHGQIVLLITRSPIRAGIEISGETWASSLTAIRRVFVGSRASLEAMNRAIAAARLRPVIDRVFGFEEAQEAFQHFMHGKLFGKVVVKGVSE
jgi:NADPH:quinone reductase-like Zn-dependent oxidoreductase